MALKTRAFLARKDKIDAAIAAACINAALKASGEAGFQYIASVAITAEDWHVAHSVGVARTAIAKANKLNSSVHRRPNDEKIDTEGAMGEWLTATLLERSGSALGVAAFVAHKAPKGEVDLVLDGERIDVKTMGQTAGRNCNINRAQHVEKAAAAYLVVHLVRADVADLYVVRAEEVAGSWQLRQGYSPYFNAYLRKQLEDLPEPVEAAG